MLPALSETMNFYLRKSRNDRIAAAFGNSLKRLQAGIVAMHLKVGYAGRGNIQTQTVSCPEFERMGRKNKMQFAFRSRRIRFFCAAERIYIIPQRKRFAVTLKIKTDVKTGVFRCGTAVQINFDLSLADYILI